jgi:hypothetical protein
MLTATDKLHTILKVLHDEKAYDRFADLRFSKEVKALTIQTFQLLTFFNDEWKLCYISLEPYEEGDRADQFLHCYLTHTHIEHTITQLQFFIQEGVSQLRVYKRFTPDSYSGLVIEIKLTADRSLTVNFLPMDPDVLELMEEELEEELPWAPEVGEKMEIPFKELSTLKL